MNSLSEPMKRIIRDFSAGSVASVNADGTPSVSPKATFVIIDDNRIAYGNIRSPGTSTNLRDRPAVEVSFVDVLARLAVRVRGRATIVARDTTQAREMQPFFEGNWSPYLDLMQEFVSIDIDNAELITSPAYDIGLTRSELVETNFEKLSKLCNN